MKRLIRTAVAAALGCCLLAANASAAPVTFTDVSSSHPLYSFISRAASEGLVSGTGGGKYEPSKQLKNCEFVSMVCSLYYKTEVDTYQQTYKPSDWWRSCMEIAYSKNLLSGTTVGDSRQTTGIWNSAIVEAAINRYDMAQIITNLSTQQGFSAPSASDLANARTKIGDWAQIPAKYQTAVSSAYARGYLSGMSDGTFSGSREFVRDQGAVVLCRLLDAKGSILSPTYTNSTNLVNGKTATEENVVSALESLQKEFPNNQVWDTTTIYKSPVLGRSSGQEAFAYMLADRVFGNMPLYTGKAEELKPGDVVYISADRAYAVITDISGGEFDYVSCSATGLISWGGHGRIANLASQDTIYGRYKGTGTYSRNGVLSDGSEPTEKNAASLLSTFERREDEAVDWTGSYASPTFGNKTVSGAEAFAYYLSDYIFGSLPYTRFNGSKDAEVWIGDVIYLYDLDEWGVVTSVTSSKIDYVTLGARGRVSWSGNSVAFSSLVREDTIYTRYPSSSGSSSSSSSKTGKLANGKDASEANVKDLIWDFLDDTKYGYDVGDTWDKEYRSSSFGSKMASGSQAFAYYLSDYIFDDLKVYETAKNDLYAGDVIRVDGEYMVVTSVSSNSIGYIGVDQNKKVYSGKINNSDLPRSGEYYSRYPSGSASSSGSSSSSKNKTLTDGSRATETNVSNLLWDVELDYPNGSSWNTSTSHSTNLFKNCTGSKAFAGVVSDEVFGKLSYTTHSKSSSLKVGDVIELDSLDHGDIDYSYVVVLSISSNRFTFAGVDDISRKITWNGSMRLSDLTEYDNIYTRY